MRFLSILTFIAAFIVFVTLVLIPTIFTWNALFGTVGGILFSIFLFPVAVMGYPIVILVAGLATGLGGTFSIAAAVIGYVTIALVIGLWCLSGWLGEKAEENERERDWVKQQMNSRDGETR